MDIAYKEANIRKYADVKNVIYYFILIKINNLTDNLTDKLAGNLSANLAN
jgi:hypothetical protein